MNRAFTNILTENVEETASFYEQILGMERAGDFGFFVLLNDKNLPGFELGILDSAHETVPEDLRQKPSGTILTFVVDDVANEHARAIEMGCKIIQPPNDLPYGQRRLLLQDPAGTSVDISSLIPK